MSPTDPFPPMPTPSLTRDEVIGVLVDVQARGWDVRRGDEEHSFIIRVTDDSGHLLTVGSDGRCGVAPWSNFGRKFVPTWCSDQAQLRRQLHHYLGGGPAPESIRMVKGEPASNLSKLAALIGTQKVLAVYDPYLDDAGLDRLRAIAHLNSGVSPGVRILTHKKPPKISKTFAQDFCAEFQCDIGNIRLMPTDEHRRLLILSAGKVVIAGPSFNNLDWNEAAHVEANSTDEPFFNHQWSLSDPMPW